MGFDEANDDESNQKANELDPQLACQIDLVCIDDFYWPITAARIVKIAKSLG
jgi:hypothetical protein